MSDECSKPKDFRSGAATKLVPKTVVDATSGVLLASVEIASSPNRVFDALMTSEVERWWKLGGVYHLRDWRVDLKVQGRWSVTVELHDGQHCNEWGEICEVDAPEKVVLTRRFGANPFLGERQTTLTYRLEPSVYGTLLTLKEEGFVGRPEAARGNAENWEKVLGWLARYCEQATV